MQPDEQREQEPRILNGRFRLQSQLAKGGMGVTYRAWDLESGRPVVVKMPKRALYDEPGFLERFDREVRATIALDHASIVSVIDHGADAGEPFLVMQFLPGGSLAGRISHHTERGRDRMPAAHLHAWLPRIAAALDHAHASGVLHRDVKPANIFFDAGGLAHLGDFGIAKVLEDSAADTADPTLTGTHIALGTHAYMAPERLAPRAVIDGRADQYALAICVFETLTGVKPFRGDTMNIVIEQATLPPPDLTELRPDIPASACQAVAKALAKRPADRFETCSDFAAAMLAEIPPAEQEAGFAWLQCPACSRLIRLPEAAAGRTGRCPRCKAELVIAQRLEGLWLPTEYGPAATEPMPAVSLEPPPQPRPWRPTAPRSWAALTAIAITAIVVPWLLWERPAPPPPDPDQAAIEPAVAAKIPPKASPEQTAALEGDSSRSDEPQQPDPGSTQGTTPRQSPTASAIDLEQPLTALPPAEAPADAKRMAHADQRAEPTPEIPDEAKDVSEAEWAAKRDAAKKHFDEVVRWVNVADPGNQPDPLTGRGAVSETFYLAQYELTNADYCVFLNASRAGKDIEAGIGDRAIVPGGSVPGISRQPRVLGQGFEYTPEPTMAQKPAVLTAADAMALANWLHNIHDSGTDAYESGVYDSLESPLDRNPGALFFIPTIDEWAKAAYFKGGKPTSGYHAYPTATSEDLVPVSGLMAEGRPSLRGVETAANFGGKAAWDGAPPDGNPTDVGQNGAPSAYGAFDMGGNVAEWAIVGSEPAASGGDFRAPLKSLARESLNTLSPMNQRVAPMVTGLRLARSMAAGTHKLRDDAFQRLKKQTASEHWAKVIKATTPAMKAINAIPNAQNRGAIQRASQAVGTAIQSLGTLDNLFNAANAPVDGNIKAAVPRIRIRLDEAKAILNQEANQPNADPLLEAARAVLGVANPQAPLPDRLAPIRKGINDDISDTTARLQQRYGRP